MLSATLLLVMLRTPRRSSCESRCLKTSSTIADFKRSGGNTGKVNTFTGVNVADLTGGAFSDSTLFQGNNFACFAFSLLQQGIPNFLNNPLNDLAPVTNLINKYVGPIVGGLSCPQQGAYSFGVFDHFPGYKYSPTGPDTNY
jgi:hypothetical protein